MKHVLQWHITHKCNLRCRHCYQEDYCSDLTEKQCEKIFRDYQHFIKKNNYRGHINFTGGEPFISSYFFDLLDLCQSSFITFGILTNGTLIDKETADRLSGYKNLKFIQVSIDGNKETHDSIRGDETFDKSFEAIRLLKKSKIQTMVSFTVHKENYKELKAVIETVRKHGVDRFWCDRLIPIDDKKSLNSNMILDTEQYKSVVEELVKERKRCIINPFCHLNVHANRALQFLADPSLPVYNCSAGINLLTILADGTLLPCRRLPLKIGNVLDNSISELVENSQVIQELTDYEGPEECRNCKFSKCCKGGAKCLNYAVTGDWKTKDINCYI